MTLRLTTLAFLCAAFMTPAAWSQPGDDGRDGALHRLPGAANHARGTTRVGGEQQQARPAPDPEAWRYKGHSFLAGHDPNARNPSSPEWQGQPAHCEAPEGGFPLDGLGAPTVEDEVRRTICGMVAGIDTLLAESQSPDFRDRLRARAEAFDANAIKRFLGPDQMALDDAQLEHVASTYRGLLDAASKAEEPTAFLLNRRQRMADPAFTAKAVDYMTQQRETVTARITAPNQIAVPSGLPANAVPDGMRPGVFRDPQTGETYVPMGDGWVQE